MQALGDLAELEEAIAILIEPNEHFSKLLHLVGRFGLRDDECHDGSLEARELEELFQVLGHVTKCLLTYLLVVDVVDDPVVLKQLFSRLSGLRISHEHLLQKSLGLFAGVLPVIAGVGDLFGRNLHKYLIF